MYKKEDCYEVRDISVTSEVEKAYRKAVDENKKYYVAISRSGKRYGWVNGKLAELTTEYAENDQYKEPVIEEVVEQPIEEIVETPVETVAETVEPETVEVADEVEEVKKDVEPVVEETPDYKALLDESLAQVNALTEEVSIKNTAIDTLRTELDKVTAELENYKAEVAIVKNFFTTNK